MYTGRRAEEEEEEEVYNLGRISRTRDSRRGFLEVGDILMATWTARQDRRTTVKS